MDRSVVLSDAEREHVKTTMRLGVRLDGRPLTMHRTPQVRLGVVPHTDGSCAVDLGGTSVLVSLSASVREAPHGVGSLAVHVVSSPKVTAQYARQLGGADRNRYARSFHAHLSRLLEGLFGAEEVSVEESTGVVDTAAAAPQGGQAEDFDTDGPARGAPSGTSSRRNAREFPFANLAVGGGFAFRIDADVQLMQCNGGNVIGAACIALRAALQTTRLPHVAVHETSAGVSIEVDRSRTWSECSSVRWNLFPTVVVAHWIPGYYLVDPTMEEEVCLPHRIVVGGGVESGSVGFVQLETLPSKHGDNTAGISMCDLRCLVGELGELCLQQRLAASASTTA